MDMPTSASLAYGSLRGTLHFSSSRSVALAVTLTRLPPPVNLLRMFGLGATELIIILAIVVLLFGARRLPEIGSGLGKAIRGFKEGVSGKDAIDVTPKKDEVTEGKKP
jgi:sec-independent protein translocase protein TatA